MFVGLKLGQVRDIQAALRLQLGRLVPGDVPTSEAPAMWEAFDAIERFATSAKTLLASRVEESRAWASHGDQSPVDFLARTSGSSRGAARAALETSKKLRRLPATETALRRGELSRSQAETIADAAALNPAAERSLLETARQSSLCELREHANLAKAAGDPDADATHRRLHRERRLRRFTDSEGAWNLHARGTADAGAVFNAALDPIIDEIFRTARREGRHESRDVYAFDALIELVRRARGHAAATGDAGPDLVPAQLRANDPSRRPDGLLPPAAAANPSFLALLRVDLAALVRGRVHAGELCEIAGVGAVPARVARNLLGDSILKLVITRGVDVANVTHLGRGPTTAQRIASLWTTPACTNSSCSHTLAIQHDHRTPWVEVRETVLDNIDRLCTPCHKRKTLDGWALVAGKGRRPLVPPDDPRHPNNQAHAPPEGTGSAPAADHLPAA